MVSTSAPAHRAGQVKFGLLITTIGGLLFTLDLPLLRLSMADHWTMVCTRGVFLFISISLAWMVLNRWGGSKAPFIAGGAGIAVAVTNTVANITYIGAIVETNAANVAFIVALVPVLTALMSNIFIKEFVHRNTWIAIGLSCVGLVIIFWDGIHTGSLLGDFMALVSAACTAAAFTIIRASGKNVATSLAVGSLASAIIAVVFFDVNFSGLTQPGSFGYAAWIWIALNGLLAIPLATALMANGPRFLPSADVSMFFLLETTLTPVWVWMLFGEVPTTRVLIGGALVVVTLLLHSWWRMRSTAYQLAE